MDGLGGLCAAATGAVAENTPECASGCSWGYLDGQRCSETCESGYYEVSGESKARVCRVTGYGAFYVSEGALRRFVADCASEGLLRLGEECVASCPSERPFNASGGCAEGCGAQFYVDNGKNSLVCVDECPSRVFTYESDAGPTGARKCVADCVEAGRYFAVRDTNSN